MNTRRTTTCRVTLRTTARGVFPLALAAALMMATATLAQEPPKPGPGDSVFANHKRVEYIVGDTPVIFTAPHGGRLKPDDIPDRQSGVLRSDFNTDELARQVADAFHRRTGRHAHVVILHLHRVKVDANRPIEDATEGDPQAIATWNAYHDTVTRVHRHVAKAHGRGLYFDLHGHGHPLPRVEIGYLLRHRELKQDDEAVAKLADKSSVRDLALRSRANFVELVRGKTSFGAMLQRRGYASVPSPAHPHNGDGKYFNGGYCTRRYASRDGGTISGFQLELPKPGVRQTDDDRDRFAAALVDAVVEYARTHLDIDLTGSE